jgi:peptidoglycan/xylan/chitin deacetylase (PgdA/CDA1 family)
LKTISFPLWPEGRVFAATFSYDDGRIQDRRLVELFNRYGLKGTFNLNASRVGKEGVIDEGEVASLYAGHEVACHFLTHPYPTRIPAAQVPAEVLEDRRRLEALSGGLVDGLAYPFGDWNAGVIAALKACGIRYARTTKATEGFGWKPEDWLAWHPTCHDRAATPAMMEKFFAVRAWDRNARLFSIWGHSYEFDREGGWEAIETVCRTLRERGGDTLWAATNGMVRDYAAAAESLRFGVDGNCVVNPSALDVWISVDGKPVRVPAGEGIADS